LYEKRVIATGCTMREAVRTGGTVSSGCSGDTSMKGVDGHERGGSGGLGAVVSCRLNLIFLLCSLLALTGAKPAREMLAYKIVERDEITNYRTARSVIKVFTEPREFESFHRYVNGHVPRTEPSAVDFSRRMAVYLSLGERNASGYTIEVARVYRQSARLFIETVLLKIPGQSTPTNPYVILSIPRVDVRWIEWIDFAGTRIDRRRVYLE
jgi:hypothetical protein